MFLVTFVRYRPDVHARWVKTEHNAKKKKKDRFFFFCVCSRNCLYNPAACAVASKLGGIYNQLI